MGKNTGVCIFVSQPTVIPFAVLTDIIVIKNSRYTGEIKLCPQNCACILILKDKANQQIPNVNAY